MAKLLDKFTKPFQDSRIPFLLAEVVTNGAGEMVDAVCRFANDAAAAALDLPAEELRGKRFTRTFPAQRLETLAPLHTVAFSGSCATFSYTTLMGQTLRITCFQPMYGLAACILDAPGSAPQSCQQSLGEQMPLAAAVVELTRTGVRCLSFNQRLCQWTGLDRKTLLDRHAEDLSTLVAPEDWPELLQALLDAAREKRPANRDFRLLRREAEPLWVNLQAEPLVTPSGGAAFYTVLSDVDAQRRAWARTEDRLRRAEADRSLLEVLVDRLPGGCCLLRRDREGHLQALRASRGLQDLLGYSEPELLRHLSADPLWRVSGGKSGLLDQAHQARQSDQPLRQVIQVRPRSGGAQWLSVDACWEPQSDGGLLICVFCADATDATEEAAQRQFRSQLCELLLDRSRVLIMDYDPARDLARIERYTAGGARASRTVAGYLTSLPETQTIHPEDRRKLASSMRRALTRSTPESLEYRGDYDGRGWRWYRISWSCLLDPTGSVSRLLGKVENIDRSHAAALRYRRLAAGQKKLSPGLLATAMLDLTADKILDAKAAGRHLTQVLFGNTADACLRHLRDNVPDSDSRGEFDALFRPVPLQEALARGQDHLTLEHPLIASEGVIVWCRTAVDLAEDPDTGHTVAFCALADCTDRRRRDQVLEALARMDYDVIVTVDAGTGLCRICAPRQDETAPGIPYRTLLGRFLRHMDPSSRQRTALRASLSLEAVTAQLAAAPAYRRALPLPEGGTLNLRWTWLDQPGCVLLLTGQRTAAEAAI